MLRVTERGGMDVLLQRDQKKGKRGSTKKSLGGEITRGSAEWEAGGPGGFNDFSRLGPGALAANGCKGGKAMLILQCGAAQVPMASSCSSGGCLGWHLTKEVSTTDRATERRSSGTSQDWERLPRARWPANGGVDVGRASNAHASEGRLSKPPIDWLTPGTNTGSLAELPGLGKGERRTCCSRTSRPEPRACCPSLC